MLTLFFSFFLSQGLTGPIGPPGPAGPNGEKVSVKENLKNTLLWSLFNVIVLHAEPSVLH